MLSLSDTDSATIREELRGTGFTEASKSLRDCDGHLLLTFCSAKITKKQKTETYPPDLHMPNKQEGGQPHRIEIPFKLRWFTR